MTEAERLAQALNDEADLCRNDGANGVALLLDKTAALLRSQAAEIEALRADAERFRWLAERTTSTGLAPWVHPFQFLCEAVDARMKAAIDAARKA